MKIKRPRGSSTGATGAQPARRLASRAPATLPTTGATPPHPADPARFAAAAQAARVKFGKLQQIAQPSIVRSAPAHRNQLTPAHRAHPAGLARLASAARAAQARFGDLVSRSARGVIHVVTASPGLPPSPGARHTPAAPGVVQRYTVESGTKIYGNTPGKRPWFSYPYAVVSTPADLLAQEPAVNVGGVHEFLQANGSNLANVVGHGGVNLSLRVSSDYEMAIENTDLTQRQPKVFYATLAVVNKANTALGQVNSDFVLVPDQTHSITILTGWWTATTLYRVSPQLNNGNPDLGPQNCNAMAGAVMGSNGDAVDSSIGTVVENLMKRLAPEAYKAYRTAWRDQSIGLDQVLDLWNDIAAEYLTEVADLEHSLGINRYAAPAVGQAFAIKSIGNGPDQGNGVSRVRDIVSGMDRDLGWPYHFGGVVAQSGTDRVTLENYARGDNRQAGRDPRWYFQMYGTGAGQGFHEFHESKQQYANPITVVVTRNS